MQNSLHDSVLRAWLGLHRTPHLSDQTLCRLIAATSCVEEIFTLSPTELAALGVSVVARRALRDTVLATDPKRRELLERDWRSLQEQQIQLLPLSHKEYPELLKQISDPPPLLYLRGRSSLLDRPQLAMVGSRQMSPQGRENAFALASELAAAGFTVTSGLALGIDTASHRGALSVKGDTIAVLGTGVDRVYPQANKPLFTQIADEGLLVSEFALGSEPRRHSFPLRNRVISGLSMGVVVVEAALKSGSLITARCALEHDREVFAVPGSIHNPASRGCHALLRQGAKLVESVADIVEELRGWVPAQNDLSAAGGSDDKPSPSQQAPLNAREVALLSFLGFDPAAIDVLQSRSGWTLSELQSTLISLELKGVVENQAGCYRRMQAVPAN